MAALEYTFLTSQMSQDAVENGAWMHIRAPVTEEGDRIGPLLYLDPDPKDPKRPCRVKVRSARSKTFRSKELNFNTVSTSRVNRAKDAKKDEMLAEAVTSEKPRRFSFLVTELENVSPNKPGSQVPTEEDLMVMAGDVDWLVDQVINFAFDDSNFPGLPPVKSKDKVPQPVTSEG